MKQIILCADDFGQNTEISEGILQLVKQNRINAVSCMVNAPQFNDHASKLALNQDKIELGLHLNLTHGCPLSPDSKKIFSSEFKGLSHLLQQLLLQKIQPGLIAEEFRAQINAFQTAFNKLPDFIDAHQHIHQFPVIRTTVLSLYEEFYPKQDAWIRLSLPQIRSVKSLMIACLGGWALKKALLQKKIPHNPSFSGAYSLQPTEYREKFRKFLDEIGNKGLIMCHPGHHSSDPNDPISAARIMEYTYLMSDSFIQDCELEGVKLLQKYGYRSIQNSSPNDHISSSLNHRDLE